jgi:hypothetical protein
MTTHHVALIAVPPSELMCLLALTPQFVASHILKSNVKENREELEWSPKPTKRRPLKYQSSVMSAPLPRIGGAPLWKRDGCIRKERVEKM